jgi:UDP-N-acetylmuramate dehydrogenase
MLEILENEPLAKHTTYRIGGPARFFALPKNLDDLNELSERIRNSKLPFFILGNGSNVLADDAGFSGWVIKTTELIQRLDFFPNERISVSASYPNLRLVRQCADHGVAGLEYLAGIPGTVGGAIAMNAGTAEGWIDQHVEIVKTFSLLGGEKTYEKSELKFSYREQHFIGPEEIILNAEFQLTKGEPDLIKAKLAASAKSRKQAQPIEMPSCGSVFRNPEGKKAWQLVEQVGLRGHTIGGAQISPKHGNFIVNLGGAHSKDVQALIQLVKKKVYDETGIKLIEEVRFLTNA